MGKWKSIVVGVDGSPSSRTALNWAAAEAADHGADLVVLNVWEHTLPPPAGSVSVSERYVPDESQRTELYRQAERKIMEQIPLVPIAQFDTHAVVAPRVRDLVLTAAGTFDASRVWLTTASGSG